MCVKDRADSDTVLGQERDPRGLEHPGCRILASVLTIPLQPCSWQDSLTEAGMDLGGHICPGWGLEWSGCPG